MLIPLLLLAIPVLSLALVLKLDDPPLGPVGRGPTGWSWLDGWLRRVRAWHLIPAFALTILLYAMVQSLHAPEPWLLLALAVVLIIFARAWRHEFVGLMLMPDEVFPGRYDKRSWMLLMIVLPPLGLGTYRSFRKAYWGEPERTASPQAKPAPFPEMQ